MSKKQNNKKTDNPQKVAEFEGKVPRTQRGKPAYGTQEATASKRIVKKAAGAHE